MVDDVMTRDITVEPEPEPFGDIISIAVGDETPTVGSRITITAIIRNTGSRGTIYTYIFIGFPRGDQIMLWPEEVYEHSRIWDAGEQLDITSLRYITQAMLDAQNQGYDIHVYTVTSKTEII